MIFRVLLALVLAWPACTSAQTAGDLPCAGTDRDCIAKAMRDHAVQKLDTWQEVMDRPLIERVEPASASLVQYLVLDNMKNGFPQRPRATEANPRFVGEVKAALAELPQQVQLLFVDKLAGIFLVDDLGGTGYTDFVNDGAGHPVAGIIVLDAAVLQKFSANEWASWKESTPFQSDPAWRLQARIENTPQDTMRNAIQYILLHELGHVLSIGGIMHPLWSVQPKDVQAPDAYPFFHLSWRIDAENNRFVTPFDAAFPQRSSVAYYFGAKLAGAQMGATYTNLLKTNFASLYASASPGDDFAEAFASYVHVVLMGRPWEITLGKNDETVQVFKACWTEPRCADKRMLLEGWLGRAP